jgi:hypothetical protein
MDQQHPGEPPSASNGSPVSMSPADWPMAAEYRADLPRRRTDVDRGAKAVPLGLPGVADPVIQVDGPDAVPDRIGVWQRFATNWAIAFMDPSHQSRGSFAFYLRTRTRHFK